MAEKSPRSNKGRAVPKGGELSELNPASGATAFPVVGIGSSAGGLEPLKQILRALPKDTGMAYVVVQHLAPGHASLLPEILARATAMHVEQVQGEPMVRPNCVYVIPPDRTMLFAQGRLKLLPREERTKHHPVDAFLCSLAEDRGHMSIGVILSGTATDGTLGLETIKAEGGIAFAQDETAQYDGMPKSAITSGCVDYVLPPERIANELTRIGRDPYVTRPLTLQPPEPDLESGLHRIVELLHESLGVDFAHYRTNTLYRRIKRRMVLHGVDGLAGYRKFLQVNPSELKELCEDILISVTSFFRDVEAFDFLKEHVFSSLTKDRSRHEPLRAWVLGCSTGEEAYSLGIAYAEFAEAAGVHIPMQIFATDVKAANIDRARAGSYPKSIAQHVSPERLRRFFIETTEGYQISKSIRDTCVFAVHNVTSEPPFSRLDLVSCRNLLIYMQPPLQQSVLSILYYALKPGGFLWLGRSEAMGPHQEGFEIADANHRIYTRKAGPLPHPGGTGARGFRLPSGRPKTEADRERIGLALRGADFQQEADRILLKRYAPPGVLVNSDMEILQFRGDTSPYLLPAPGKASLDLMKMAREGLLVGLRAAILRARKSEMPASEKGLRVKLADGYREVDVEVVPVRTTAVPNACFLIVFTDSSAPAQSPAAPPPNHGAGADSTGELERQVQGLMQELAATREYLQSTIEQREGSNEELQSANEEIQSANEELQSVNEELETSKEEIESSNEELATLNEELQNRNLELGHSNDDLSNLISSVQMPIVMLGPDLRLRRFTPSAAEFLNLVPADMGRPLSDIKLSIELPRMEPALRNVIDTATRVEHQVQDRQGRWHLVRISPYQKGNDVAGAVVAFVDVDNLRRAQTAVIESEERYRLLVEGARDFAIMMLDSDGRVASWNMGAERIFGYEVQEILGKPMASLFAAEDVAAGSPERVLRRAQAEDATSHEHWLVRRDGSRFWGMGSTTVLRDDRGQVRGYAKVIRDMTTQKKLEEDLRSRVNELADADRSRNEFLAMLAHELRGPLAPLSNAMHLLHDRRTADSRRSEALQIMDRQLGHMARLVDDLLDASRIMHGTIPLRKSPVDLVGVLMHAVEDVRPKLTARDQEISLSLVQEPLWLNGDATRLHQVFCNLLDNASKYSAEESHIQLTAERVRAEIGDEVVVRVRDDGIGIDSAMLPRVFELFSQADNSASRSRGGLGIGLTVAKNLVTRHGGTIEARSDGLDKGSEFVVRLPLVPDPQDSEPRSTAPSAPATGSPERILVVDDNVDGAHSMSLLLRAAGHEVQAAFGSQDCFEAVASFRPQVIILDLGLPGVDGFEIARRLRGNPDTNDVVLIALSGYGGDEARQKTREIGFDYHLVKPADLDMLHQILASSARRADASSKKS